MTLGEARRQFTVDIAGLVARITGAGMMCQIEEASRSNEQAAINAMGDSARHALVALLSAPGADGRFHALAIALMDNEGNGILNSNHRIGLAVDLSLFKADGSYCIALSDYQPFGEWWEAKRPGLTMWGGRFHDADHFSYLWNGVK
jgi:hypothetical protein